MTLRFGKSLSPWLAAWLAISLVGCGSNTTGPKRSVTSGTVSFDGKPVATGQIRFLPLDGPPSQAPVTKGVYLVDYKGGVPVGQVRVEIDSYEPTGRDIPIGAGGKTEKEVLQTLPAKFNSKSELKVEIKPGQKNMHNFDLKS